MNTRLIRAVSEFRIALSAFMWSGSSCRFGPYTVETLPLFRCLGK